MWKRVTGSEEEDEEELTIGSGSSDNGSEEVMETGEVSEDSLSEDEDDCEEAKSFRNSVYQTVQTGKSSGGDFAVSGELKNAPVCVIDVENYGKLTFPVFENQARQLIHRLEQAPFGKGTETVVDKSVRNSWQLDPTKFKILNPSWETFMQAEVLPALMKAFDFEKTKIGASLYKFLLYETGSFFKPHRDTEKENGMFGTLIIQLPSDYDGGKLVVRHDGKSKTIDFSSEGKHCGRAYSTFFSALYCDCEHELLPVSKGYRACLVYNLISHGSDFVPVVPTMSATEKKLIELLKNWPLESQRKIVFVLSHKYSNAGLSFRNLKTTDKAMADLLRRVSKECSIAVALGQLSKHVSGQAENDDDEGYYNRYSGKRSRNSYRELVHYTDDGYPETTYEFTVKESTGGNIEVKDLTVELKMEVMPPSCFKKLSEPDEVEYGGYTGNCPGELDHWYRLAALIIWPTANFLRIAEGQNFSQSTVLSEFLKSVDAVGPEPDQDNKAKIVQLCEQLLKTLGHGNGGFKDETLGLRTLWVVAEVCDLPLLQRYLAKFPQISPTMIPFLVAQCEMYGWETLTPQLQEILKSKSKSEAVAFLKDLMGDYNNSNPQKQTVMKNLANFLLDKAFPGTEGGGYSSLYYSYMGSRLSNPGVYDSDKQFFSAILLIFREMNIELLDFVKSKSNKQILNILGPACLAATDEPSGIPALDPYLQPLVAHFVSQLKSITSGYNPPSMTRTEKIPCQCSDCTQLQAFLNSSRESMGFKMGKNRRMHIHQRLERMDNITHVTTRTGNPFTLVVTKTHVSQQASDMSAYNALLSQLREKFQMSGPTTSTASAGTASTETEVITLSQ